MNKTFWIIFFTASFYLGMTKDVMGQKQKVLGINYFSQFFGHVHKNPSRYSTSLTTITCGHPVKIYKPKAGSDNAFFAENWHFVKAGPYKGYINKANLSKKRPECFQDRFPKFFDQLDLDLSEMYYWGKLYDQYLVGKSKVR